MQQLIQALTWTFLHSLWQGLLAALFAAIIISSTRRSSARLRYNMLGMLLLFFMAAAIITFFTQLNSPNRAIASGGFSILGDDQPISNTSPFLDNFMSWVNSNASVLMMAWVFFFLFSCLRLFTGVAAANRLRIYKVHPVPGEWKNKLEQLQLAMNIRRTVLFLQSELVKVPMALGVLKPVILVPIGLLTHLPAEQIETILLHELAHIRRKDYLINLLQHIAETVFFFNPALRWISSLVRQEREACCDDMVLASGSPKTSYLNALVSFQEFSQNRASFAMGISSKRQYLLNRVKRILTNTNSGINLFEKMALLAAIVLFSAFSFMTQQKETKLIPATILQEPAPIIRDLSTRPSLMTVKQQKKTITRSTPQTPDTIPRKKDTVAVGIKKTDPLPADKDLKKAAADAKLQEIIAIKDQIGLKKESIGEKKEELKGKEGKEKEDILKKIADDRSDLENKRKVLQKKRQEWEDLKKVAAQPNNLFKNKPNTLFTNQPNKLFKKLPDPANLDSKQGIDPKKTTELKKDPTTQKVVNPDVNFRQELQHKLKMQIKNSPPFVKAPPGPMKPKSPDAPVKKKMD